MKTNLTTSIAFFCAVILGACSKEQPQQSNHIPDCMNAKIIEMRNIGCSSRDTLKEYLFQGQTVFVYQTGICGDDFSSPVIDTNCNEIGYLGGFAGNVSVLGVNFNKEAVFVKNVWHN